MQCKALQDAGCPLRQQHACARHTDDLPPAEAGGDNSTGEAESGSEAKQLNGVHQAARSSPTVQSPPAAAQQAQAVDLSNLFAGIWMDNADDEDTPASGELVAASG